MRRRPPTRSCARWFPGWPSSVEPRESLERWGVARDSIEEALAWPGRIWERVKALRWPQWAQWPPAATAERRGLGLSAKLLLLTIVFVMLAEVLIFVPSVANFRIGWLTDRTTAAQLAALAAEAG